MIDTTSFSTITRPGRYLGEEYNAVTKAAATVELSCALIFPDLYEVGMSHQGLQILYHILNREPDIVAERCYCPDLDCEQLLRRQGRPLTTLESARPLAAFDLIGITLPYELCATNILTVLDLAGIPLPATDRDASQPLIIGGGAGAMNPEPVADFFDAILLGDGEEAIVDIARLLIAAKRQRTGKKELLQRLAAIAGVYVPSLYTPEYDHRGRIVAIRANPAAPAAIRRRVLPDLDAIDHLLAPIVPNAKIIHDRLSIEIARGCSRGCRFCQAGMTYRPVRERTPEVIMELAEAGIANSGFEELALLSLSTGDYSCIEQVLPRLMDRFADDCVSVSMPSMRVGTLSPAIMDQIKRVRKTGFTLAPEAGSDRLRRVINKGITEDDLLATCGHAFALGWKVMKFYFMIGLPTETDADIQAIIDLVRKVKKEGDRDGRGRRQLNVSIGTFVPKPHTPFQWEKQMSMNESRTVINHLREWLPRGCTLKWHDPRMSYLEGVFSRGDRRLAALIRLAWENGARLDGWSDHFDLAIWQQAAEKLGLDLDDYLRERGDDEILPWRHLHSGVDDRFLRAERQRAFQESYTPDCRYHDCQGCGLCDFEIIRPVVIDRDRFTAGPEDPAPPAPPAPAAGRRDRPAHAEAHHRYLVTYSRRGRICYLGHLEILRLLFRTLRRAGIATNFTKGFNPTPKVSFGPALPVGTESVAEFLIMDLPAPLADPATALARLNDKLPPGLTVTAITRQQGAIAADIESAYSVTLPRPLTADDRRRLEAFAAGGEYRVVKVRKGREQTVDIRPLVTALRPTGADSIELRLLSLSGRPGIKPVEALQAILGLDPATALGLTILKTAWRPAENA
ncbi:radical SAM family uncharacterized protein/radical SAM-linked protein [Desulfoprunum benzoelyticum]|uniref:Radical SAM family uncharacterized protein/radical SAM-linked protein n=3 Tax=Desulfoprunum benzoelyticum TaxID=1506996 RepID=A0A840UZP9_9BACT|nr:TIGR03960 family B12-binding radical SAM protein [Desulfoprunum benzoelyticum]MBB5348924.1 radical SAM family uncharacterized protein/radical SAM-linked protein [Desulfoprunum benzoelyticum]